MSRIILLSAAVATVSIFTLAAADAQPSQTNAPISAEQALEIDARSYARSYGVDLAEAKRRVAIMANAGDEVAAIEMAEGDALSGVYFDHQQGFRLVVRTTGKKTGQQKIKVRDTATGAENELAVHYLPDGKVSRRVAKAFMKDNKKSLRATFPNLQSFGYEDKTGSVYLLLKGQPGTEAQYEAQRLDAEKRFKVPIRIEVHNGSVGPAAMRGGSSLYRPGATSHFCTTAFAAADTNGNVGMVTAGHCQGPAVWKEAGKEYTLTEGWYYFNPFEDWGFWSGHPAEGYFNAENGTAARKLSGRRTKANTASRETDPTASAVVGSYVCFYGMSTAPHNGQECGEVWSTYANPNYSPPTSPYGCSRGPDFVGCEANFVEVRPAKGETVNCRLGDSGAPWFAYTTAFGIQSGCAWAVEGDPKASRLFYTSTDELYFWGFSLVYPQ